VTAASIAAGLELQMPLDAANPLVEFADQNAVVEHGRMVIRHRLSQRSETGGEVIELAVVPGDRVGDLRRQLIDGCDIRTVGPLMRKIDAALTPPGQAPRVLRSPDLPCDRAC